MHWLLPVRPFFEDAAIVFPMPVVKAGGIDTKRAASMIIFQNIRLASYMNINDVNKNCVWKVILEIFVYYMMKLAKIVRPHSIFLTLLYDVQVLDKNLGFTWNAL